MVDAHVDFFLDPFDIVTSGTISTLLKLCWKGNESVLSEHGRKLNLMYIGNEIIEFLHAFIKSSCPQIRYQLYE
jgi:hypothetical protein